MDTTAPVPTHLLERAYQFIKANQIQSAELVLDAMVRVEPQNVAAWKAYLQIHQTQSDLDWLKERILKTKELSEADKTELSNYHQGLTMELNGAQAGIPSQDFLFFSQDKNEEATPEEINIRFELIDVFDYPVRSVKKETRARPRQRALYTAFVTDIASGILKALSRDPFGKKIAGQIEKIVFLTTEFVKKPHEVYLGLSKSAHFEKTIGIALLSLFAMGIRLAMSNYLFGYVFLALFIIAGGRWLLGLEGGTLGGQARVYSSENKNSLPVIKEVETDQGQKSHSEDSEKTAK